MTALLTRWIAPALVLLAAWAAPAHARAACGLSVPGATQRVLLHGTGRAMMLHLPKGFSPGRPAPLVLLLHGSGGTGEAILETSHLTETADRHGFVVVAPDAGIAVGKGFAWNIPGVPTVTGKVPTASDSDDVAFLGEVIDWLAAKRCIDRSRVYASGFSGGGRMTSWLGCVAADRIAAIAPVVGLRAGNPLESDPGRPDPATCRPSRPMPVIAFAGDRDATNPVGGGGAGYWQYTMAAAERRWAALNACRLDRKTAIIATNVEEKRYSGCRGGAEVVGRLVRGRGHEWVADNDAMWAFFARHSRR